MADEFYVYVHRRADTGALFYVGKGKGRRAWVRQHRTSYWRRVVAKHGLEVNVVAGGLDEELAHLAEVELIAKCRAFGTKLANVTDGGEGMSGYKWTPPAAKRRGDAQRGQRRPSTSEKLKGRAKSEDHRRALATACVGRKASEEARHKMSMSRKGRPSGMLGKKHRLESIEKIRTATTGEKNPFFGKTHDPETVAKIAAANAGRRDSDETRALKSAARQGPRNPRFGQRVPDEQKARQIAALKARPRVACPHCAKTLDEANAKRWHFDNCKERT